MTRRALTVAGSDSGGGAGIQADLHTFHELGVYGMSVITAVTAQNSCGVQDVYSLPASCVADQMRAVLTDIGADAVKTGLLPSADAIVTIARLLRQYGVSRLVIDPVMSATQHNRSLLDQHAIEALKEQLFPLAEIITPNIPEACRLLGVPHLATVADMKGAARELHRFGPRHVIVKGGHLPAADDNTHIATDVWYDGNRFVELSATYLHIANSHGTGCVYSAALTAELANGSSVSHAIHTAKKLVTAAIAHAFNLGSCGGPVNPAGWRLEPDA